MQNISVAVNTYGKFETLDDAMSEKAVPVLAAAVAEIPAVREEWAPESIVRNSWMPICPCVCHQTPQRGPFVTQVVRQATTYLMTRVLSHLLLLWLSIHCCFSCGCGPGTPGTPRLRQRLGEDLAPHVVAGEALRRFKSEAQRLGAQAAATARELERRLVRSGEVWRGLGPPESAFFQSLDFFL